MCRSPQKTPAKHTFSKKTHFLPDVILHITFLCISLEVLWAFQAGTGLRNRMRSQRCNRLKEIRHFPFDLLQNPLIAVGCRAKSVSKAAGMVPSAGGCPLARVNGSGVGRRGGWGSSGERRKSKIKNFSAWFSQSNSRSKNRGQNHNDTLIWHALAIVCMYMRAWNLFCAAHIMSHFGPRIIDKGHRLTFSQLGIATVHPADWCARRQKKHTLESDVSVHAHSEQINESNSTPNLGNRACNLGRLRCVSLISQHVYSWIQNQRRRPSFFVIQMYSGIFWNAPSR